MSVPPRPANGEAPFAPHELFFSRTDTRGVILAANRVFQRVCDHPWEVLLGAPHKLIRHPDMPRGVFWLLWQALQRGEPIGAYVKNRARDGLQYWVFATISPIEGGFMSTRLKPSAALLPTVEAEYALLRARELAEDLTPDASAEILLARLKTLGFDSYSAFMCHAACQELWDFSDRTHRRAAPQMRPLQRALENVADLQKQTAILYQNLHNLRCTPVNMRLTASRIEGTGGPIGLMAHNYATVLKEVEDWLRAFLDTPHGDLTKIAAATHAAAFDFATSQIQALAIEQFASEAVPEFAAEIEAEMQILDRQAEILESRATKSLGMIRHHALALDWAIRDMRRGCAGLNATRMMCKAEAARLRGAGGLGAIVEMLDMVQTDTEAQAAIILDASMRLLKEIETLQSIEGEERPAVHPGIAKRTAVVSAHPA